MGPKKSVSKRIRNLEVSPRMDKEDLYIKNALRGNKTSINRSSEIIDRHIRKEINKLYNKEKKLQGTNNMEHLTTDFMSESEKSEKSDEKKGGNHKRSNHKRSNHKRRTIKNRK